MYVPPTRVALRYVRYAHCQVNGNLLQVTAMARVNGFIGVGFSASRYMVGTHCNGIDTVISDSCLSTTDSHAIIAMNTRTGPVIEERELRGYSEVQVVLYIALP